MSLTELRSLLQRHTRRDGSTAIDGVRICRSSQGVPERSGMSGTVLAVVAQGRKQLAVGDRVLEYGAGQYLVASVDLPVTGRCAGGDPDDPALGFGMTLEPADIADVLLNSEEAARLRPSSVHTGLGIGVGDISVELLDAVVRLVRLLDHPRDRAVLVPMVKREILWRLITGEQGNAVRELGLASSRLTHVRRAIHWIRQNFESSFRVEDVAQIAGMSVSAFHRNFQEVTAMTPIQFQKNLRLREARLLFTQQATDVSGVSSRVGYHNPSQFSREYRRQFGVPPSVDAARLRELSTPESVDLML